jgi:hypothetical protein
VTPNKSSSRESYTQRIVLLLLPVFGVIALKGITFLRHPPKSVAATGVNTEKVAASGEADQKLVITEMKKYLVSTAEAVKDRDFAEARDHYNEFHNKWTTIEEAFKGKSRSNYEEIEEGMDKVKSSLINTTTPDKDTALAGIGRLNRALDNYTSSVFK